MVIFLHGEDDFLVGRRKQALMRAFVKKYTTAEIFVFDFEDQGTLPDVRRALGACEGGLFASEKMVVFLHPLVLGDEAEKVMTTFLTEHASGLPEKTILLFVHVGKLKKSQPLAKALLDNMDKEEVYDAPDGRAIENLVRKELATFHETVHFDTEALRMFLALTGGDLARMLSEMEKLATYKKEGAITTEDIATLISVPEEQNIFVALDALGKGDRKRALFLFRKAALSSGGVFSVLSMFAWQVRRLLLVREAFERGIRRSSDVVIATKLPPFTVEKALAVIEQFPLSRLKTGLTLLSDIDTNLKQGKADPETSLDLFVWKF
ncbi:MAG: DNA polymerase III subunit delta [Candidatus Moranbacteria bacterium]|nr:DNA polymerase III subunit delta [Candidatus Moranbacteria bacterium]